MTKSQGWEDYAGMTGERDYNEAWGKYEGGVMFIILIMVIVSKVFALCQNLYCTI